MLECGKYSLETLSDLQDNNLPLLTAWYVRHHIKQCLVCTREWQRLQQLQTAAKNWHRTATLSPGRYAPPLSVQEPLPVVRRRPNIAIRGAMLMGMVVTLTGGAFLLFNPLMTTPSAFAQVEQATTNIKTAHWTVTYSHLDCRTNKATHWRAEKFVRLLTPALRTEYGSGNFEVETPGLRLTVGQSAKNPHQMMATLVDNNSIRWPQEPENPQERFRQRLIHEFLETPSPIPGKVTKKYQWTLRMERVEGRLLQRFDDGLFKQASVRNDKLIAPGGFRRTIWADPETHRVVRNRNEYYDGITHYIFVNDNFHYDEPLATNLFSLKPPPDVILRR